MQSLLLSCHSDVTCGDPYVSCTTANNNLFPSRNVFPPSLFAEFSFLCLCPRFGVTSHGVTCLTGSPMPWSGCPCSPAGCEVLQKPHGTVGTTETDICIPLASTVKLLTDFALHCRCSSIIAMNPINNNWWRLSNEYWENHSAYSRRIPFFSCYTEHLHS